MSMFSSPARAWYSFLICAVALAPSLAGAQEKPVAGADAAFEKLFDTMRKNDWAACSRMMHPDALAEFHRFFASLAEADESGEMARDFLGVQKPQDVITLTPSDMFERVMRGVSAMDPVMSEILSTSTATILGTVPEGDVVHVVYRVRMGTEGARVSKIAVAPFKPRGDEWRALLTGEMEGMIQALRNQAGN